MNVFQKSSRLNDLENLTQKNEEKLDPIELIKEIKSITKESKNFKLKRDKNLSLRVSQETFKQMKDITEETNLSQADIITILLDDLIQKVGK